MFDPPNSVLDFSNPDTTYQYLVWKCLNYGDEIQTRNSKVKRISGEKLKFTTTPLVCVRKTAWKNALFEWQWFMSGSNNIKDLEPSVRKWWLPWCDEDGRIPYNYSQQFRHQYGCDRDGLNRELIHCDQIEQFIRGIKEHPYSRRHVISTWNTAEMTQPDCPITNCHGTVIQAIVTANRLKLITYQRSADLIVGLGANWIQMAAFHLWLCTQTGLVIDSLEWVGGDIHVYEQHYELARKILEQKPQESPQLMYFSDRHSEFNANDFELDKEYTPALNEKAEMIV